VLDEKLVRLVAISNSMSQANKGSNSRKS
jgi:hypothetical protein